MLFLFFLILLLLAGGGGYYLINKYEQTITSLKVKLNLLSSELSKNTSNHQNLKLDNFTINFLDVENINGTLIQNSNLYLFPHSISPVLYKSSEDISVTILTKASITGHIWYFVSLSIESSTNSKGWAASSSLSISPTSELKSDEKVQTNSQ